MKIKMTRLPLYLGIIIVLIAIFTTTLKLGEKALYSSGIIKAQQNTVKISLNYSPPDIITLAVNGDKIISGGDFTLSYNNIDVDILPSSLTGLSGYITTGGELISDKGKYSFSTVNSDKPISTGILASFRITDKNTSDDKKISRIKISFDASKSRIYGENLEVLQVNFNGIE